MRVPGGDVAGPRSRCGASGRRRSLKQLWSSSPGRCRGKCACENACGTIAPPADPQDDRGGLLGRAKIMPPNIWDTQFTSGDVFASPPVYPSSSYTRIPTPSDNPDTGRIPERTSMGQPVPEDGDGGQGVIPTPRFPRSSSIGNSFDLMWRNFKNCGVDQQRLQIEEPHFDKFPTPQTLSRWKIKFKTEVCSSSNFPHGGYVMDQRSRDGHFSRRFKNFCDLFRDLLLFPDFELMA